jgi:phytoene dehydrogenase-like protein
MSAAPLSEAADVVVIGAGHNSLIAAAYLAVAGLEVVVLEDRPIVGGNTVTEELTLPGHLHDSCSSAHVLLQSNPVIRDDELGLAELGLRYVHTDPAVVLPFADGTSLVMHRDVDRSAAEIARFDEDDAQAFVTMLAEWRNGLSAAHTRWNAGRLDPARNADDARYARLRAGSAVDTIRERFRHPRIIDAMAWMSFATIQRLDRAGTGILPFSILAGRTAFGWSTPIGGSGALPAALVARIEKHGGTVATSTAVERILVTDGRASGVRTADGRTITARRAVLSSAHLTHLPQLLAGAALPEAMAGSVAAAAAAWRPGLSLFAVHLVTSGQLAYPTDSGPVGSVAGGIGSLDGLLAQYEAFDNGVPDARDPWLLVVCSTLVDPDRAPEGHGIVKFLTIAPYALAGGSSWVEESDRYAQALLRHARTRIDGLADADVLAIAAEGPTDLERRNRHNVGGSCHGGELVGPDGEILVGWPDHRLPVPGLYQTGSTAHPGGSVAGRAGRNAARAVLADLGIDPGTVMGDG